MRGRTIALIVTACYALPTAYALAWTWRHTKPQYHGMDWIGIDLLTYPSYAVPSLFPHGDRVPSPVAALVGLVLNSIAIYLVVRLYQRWAGKLTNADALSGTQS